MSVREIDGQDYNHWLAELVNKIRRSQLKTALKVNSDLLALYWYLGKAITEKQEQANWGDKIITQLANDLILEFPALKGFSATNLKYIRKWYQFYTANGQQGVDQIETSLDSPGKIGQQAVDLLQQSDNEFPPLLGTIPWGHHIQIFVHSKSMEEAVFFIHQTSIHNWSRSILIYHLESGLFQRKGKSYNNFKIALPDPQSELANELIKNQYNLDFLGLGEEATERQLESSILSNIKKFMLELGSGFSFLGQQYRVRVGDNDYYLDLVFYHVRLHCYFLIELKVVEFKPEYAGKLEFYLTAFDDLIKSPGDNPTIGLLLCKTIDKVIVEYTLRNKVKAMGVSEYRHSLPDELKNELPDVEALKLELKKEISIPPKSIDEKLDKFKELIGKLKAGKPGLEKNDAIVKRMIDEVAQPLIRLIDLKLSEIKSEFNSTKIEIFYNSQPVGRYNIGFDIASDTKLENIWMLGFQITFGGFEKGGKHAFDSWYKFEIHLDKYKFIIGPERNKIWEDRAYNDLFSKEELDTIANRFVEIIIDDIAERIHNLLNIPSSF